MGNKTSVPQVSSSCYNSRSSLAPTRRSFVQCPDIKEISNCSSENVCDNSIIIAKSKSEGRKSSVSFEPQFNNLLLSINRDVVKPSAYKRKNQKAKKSIKIISSLSRSKKANKKTENGLNTLETPDILPTFSDITAATSHSSNMTTEVKSTSSDSQIAKMSKRVGLRRDHLIHTKEIIHPDTGLSQEEPLLRCMDQSPHVSIGQGIVKRKVFLKKVDREAPLPPKKFVTNLIPEQSEYKYNEAMRVADCVDIKSSAVTNPEVSCDYELLKSFAEDENHVLEESSNTTDAVTQQYVIPVSSDDSTASGNSIPLNWNHPETAILDEEYNMKDQPADTKDALDESGIDQSILDLIDKEEEVDEEIKISQGFHANIPNLLPALNDEDSTSGETQLFMNEVTILRNEDRLSALLHDDKKLVHASFRKEPVDQKKAHDCDSLQTYQLYQDNSLKNHEPAFTSQAISNASFLFSYDNKVERSSSYNSAISTDDIDQRIYHINIEESSNRLSGEMNHRLSEIYVKDLLEKARKNEEKRRHNELNGFAFTKLPLPFRGASNSDYSIINIDIEQRRSVQPTRESSETQSELSSVAPKEDANSKPVGHDESSEEHFAVTKNTEIYPHDDPECNIKLDDISSRSSSENDQPVNIMNRTAMTPRKSHSPFIRFKSAMKHFEKPITQEGNEPILGKSPTRTMLSSKGFVVNAVTELNGRLRRNIQRPPKEERRLTMGNDVIAPKRSKLVNPIFRSYENNKKCSIEAGPSALCNKTTEWEPPREILCDLTNKIPSTCERRISKSIRGERLVDKLPGDEDAKVHEYGQMNNDTPIAMDNEAPDLSGFKDHYNEDCHTSQISPYQSSNAYDSVEPSIISSYFPNDHQSIPTSPIGVLAESLSCMVQLMDAKLENSADVGGIFPTKEGRSLNYDEEKDELTEVDVHKLASWSVEDLISEQEENTVKPIDSPTENSISLCIVSPTILPNSVTRSDDSSSSIAAKTNPSALCLSPTQRTPMQAKKWRTLAAQAEAKKKNTHKKSTGKKTKGYTDV